MKSGWKGFFVLLGVSGVLAFLGAYVVYKFFPQYLCYVVYDVSEADLYEKEEKAVASGAQYTEYFVPQNAYLKSIIVSMGVKTAKSDMDDGQYVAASLVDEENNVLAESKLWVEASDKLSFCEFEIERWVDSEGVYGLVLEFSDSGGVFVTFVPSDAGPQEHQRLIYENEVLGENIYLQYVYGSFSKKLLAMWFLVFFVSVGLLGECFLRHGKK